MKDEVREWGVGNSPAANDLAEAMFLAMTTKPLYVHSRRQLKYKQILYKTISTLERKTRRWYSEKLHVEYTQSPMRWHLLGHGRGGRIWQTINVDVHATRGPGMFEPDKKDGDIVRGMLVQRMFDQGVAGSLSILDVAHKVHRTLVADDIPELDNRLSASDMNGGKRDPLHRKPGSRTRLLRKALSPWYRVRRRQTPSSRYLPDSSSLPRLH